MYDPAYPENLIAIFQKKKCSSKKKLMLIHIYHSFM